ncbi:MAG TPA: DUF5655 domain-containing protein [Rubrivivax sp.]|nr:DUF5655 domain-containing protein [Rubrivivax sp.]
MTQLRHIQSRTGKTLAELLDAVRAAGLAKHGERRSWLMERFKLGYGDANTVALFADKPLPDLAGAAPAALPAVHEGDPLDALYTGAKAHLRPLHERVMQAVAALGPCEQAPKKTYVSLRRKKQFAMLGPATKDRVELGLNAKNLPPHARLKAMPPGGMCQYTVRLGQASEVDDTLVGWLRAAYDAAG